MGRGLSDELPDGLDIVDCSMSPDLGESSKELTNDLGVGNRLTSIGLTNTFFDFRQEAEPFDGILKGGRIRKSLDNLKDFLFHRFSGHRDHLICLVL